MDKYFDALEKSKTGFQENLFVSFGFKQDKQQELKKSHIIDSFSYGDSKFSISKRGKEIKEKLLRVLEDEKSDVSGYISKIEGLKSKIEEEPTIPFSESYYYVIDGWEDKVPTLPLVYNYSYPDKEISMGQSEVADKEDLRRKYNDTVFKLVQCYIEIKMVETMMDSFEDTRLYDLNVRQASMLGF